LASSVPAPERHTERRPPDTAYAAGVRELSDRIVQAQREIRVLDAVQWDDSILQGFMAADGKELPRVDREYYQSRALPFNIDAKIEELREIERDIAARLGQMNPLGAILARICREYRLVVQMLAARGTAEFPRISAELYGSPGDVFHAGDPTLADMSMWMAEALGNIERSRSLTEDEKNIPGTEAVKWLQERLDTAFGDVDHRVAVTTSDGIIADAAAGANRLKLRADATFSTRDLRILEVHEGWVHLGTTLNGMRQPFCTFLSKGPPSATVTQEGLAVLMEVMSLATHPARLWRITDRVRAIRMAEQGADFIEVFRFFEERGASREGSYRNAQRVFRGSTPRGGPFTKDLSYSKGFVQVYNFVQLAVRRGALELIPLLFVGKMALQDVRVVADLIDEGLIDKPAYLPPPIADLAALSAWMCFANFFHRLSIDRIEADYGALL
jgi:uncharacterized protein (TIGR02421 family)